MRTILSAMLAIAVSTPLYAQRGGQPPVRIDSSAIRRTPDGPILDFKDADIAVVLNAIAEVGNLNVQIQRAPSVRITLRVSTNMTKETAAEMLKMVAEANGFTVNEGTSLIQLLGPIPTPQPTPQQLAAQQQQALAAQQRIRKLEVIRLKHARASTVAPMLMSLLRGVGGTTAGRGNQPFNNVPQGINNGRGGAANNAGGRGGRAGQANVPIQIQGGNVQIPPAIANNPGLQILNGLLGGGGGGGGNGVTSNLAFSDINIIADDQTNSLMVLATAEDFQAIQPLLQSIDLRPLQVLIEVTIAQVERSNDLNVGLSAVTTKNGKKTTSTSTTSTNAAGVTSTTSSSTTTGKVDTTAIFPSAATARDFIAQLIGGRGSVNYAVAINALQSRGEVKVLSLPLIIAQNNLQSVLNVGARVPFVQVSQTVVNDPTGRVQTVQYQDVGTTLTITPTINTDGYVNLAVTQTSDNLTNNVQFDAQIINTRQAQTTVFVRDGQTTVIGGLTDNTQSNNRAGIPILSKIPFIGGVLFGNTQKSKVTSELFLFLTPHIVSSDEDIDRLRESVRSQSDLLKDIDLHRINPTGDTIKIGIPMDSAKKLPPLPKRPPGRDTMSTGDSLYNLLTRR